MGLLDNMKDKATDIKKKADSTDVDDKAMAKIKEMQKKKQADQQ